MPEISNPAKHVHRLTMVGGQATCQDCGEVVITPILDFDDERLKHDVVTEDLAVNGQPASLWIEALMAQCPMRLDLMLIELSERLAYEWPDYIDQLAGLTKGENPPHLSDPELGEVE